VIISDEFIQIKLGLSIRIGAKIGTNVKDKNRILGFGDW
jgi:hypothetical protein